MACEHILLGVRLSDIFQWVGLFSAITLDKFCFFFSYFLGEPLPNTIECQMRQITHLYVSVKCTMMLFTYIYCYILRQQQTWMGYGHYRIRALALKVYVYQMLNVTLGNGNVQVLVARSQLEDLADP